MKKNKLMRIRSNLLVEELFLPSCLHASKGTTCLTDGSTTAASLASTAPQVAQLAHLGDSVEHPAITLRNRTGVLAMKNIQILTGSPRDRVGSSNAEQKTSSYRL